MNSNLTEVALPILYLLHNTRALGYDPSHSVPLAQGHKDNYKVRPIFKDPCPDHRERFTRKAIEITEQDKITR